MDGFKEIFESLSNRIKSPILGSIAMLAILVNWKAWMYVVFNSNSFEKRFEYFDANTNAWSLFVFPICWGIMFAISRPYIDEWGTGVIKNAVLGRKEIQENTAFELEMKKMSFQDQLVKKKLELEKKRTRVFAEKEAQGKITNKINPVGIKDSISQKRREKKTNEKNQDSNLIQKLRSLMTELSFNIYFENLLNGKIQNDPRITLNKLNNFIDEGTSFFFDDDMQQKFEQFKFDFSELTQFIIQNYVKSTDGSSYNLTGKRDRYDNLAKNVKNSYRELLYKAKRDTIIA